MKRTIYSREQVHLFVREWGSDADQRQFELSIDGWQIACGDDIDEVAAHLEELIDDLRGAYLAARGYNPDSQEQDPPP